ncbi:winged helix-turn-helix transcriptional regulator [Actinoplanes sp. G11-F43]|uniref:winged helix-turn-helix transcriptional regulator n=1 Tax=Actinoplanes sp. G11-F43 TaxID=3424130 RepID=UPI003D35359E
MSVPTPVPAGEYAACPVTDVLRLLSDKWALLLITLLGQRPYRFNELHRAIDGISQRMLTRTLRHLASDGLVEREIFATVPPSVEYRLTPLGDSLLEPVHALAGWAVAHHPEIARARAASSSDRIGPPADGSGPPTDRGGPSADRFGPFGDRGRSPADRFGSPLDRPGQATDDAAFEETEEDQRGHHRQ